MAEQNVPKDLSSEFELIRESIGSVKHFRGMFNNASLFSLWQLVTQMPQRKPGQHAGLGAEGDRRNTFETRHNHVLTFLGDIYRYFEDFWPDPRKPTDPSIDATKHEQRQYQRAYQDWNRAHTLRERQIQDLKRWFVGQAVLSWPGRREAAADIMRPHMPDPILQEDYPRYVQAAVWYLRDAVDADGNRLAKVAADLKGKSLHDLRAAYNEVFTTHVTSQHLQSCDAQFLNVPIADDVTERHPNKEEAIYHAQILGTGKTHDGKGWTLRQLNSRQAAEKYGNPSQDPGGSSLCFTWPNQKGNHFKTYENGLMMLATDDGSVTRFLHLGRRMFCDQYDKAVSMDSIYEEFKDVDAPIIASLRMSIPVLKDMAPVNDITNYLMNMADRSDFQEEAKDLIDFTAKKFLRTNAQGIKFMVDEVLKFIRPFSDPERYPVFQSEVQKYLQICIDDGQERFAEGKNQNLYEALKVSAQYQALNALGTESFLMAVDHYMACQDWAQIKFLFGLFEKAPVWQEAIAPQMPDIMRQIFESASTQDVVEILEYMRKENQGRPVDTGVEILLAAADPVVVEKSPVLIADIRDRGTPEFYTRSLNAIWRHQVWEDAVMDIVLGDAAHLFFALARQRGYVGMSLLTEMHTVPKINQAIATAIPDILDQSVERQCLDETLKVIDKYTDWTAAAGHWIEAKGLASASAGKFHRFMSLAIAASGNGHWEKCLNKSMKRMHDDLLEQIAAPEMQPHIPLFLSVACKSQDWQRIAAPLARRYVLEGLDKCMVGDHTNPNRFHMVDILGVAASGGAPWAGLKRTIAAQYLPRLVRLNPSLKLQELINEDPVWKAAQKTGRHFPSITL